MPDTGAGSSAPSEGAATAGVLLAAGMSRRAGRLKQTLDWAGQTMLRHTATTLLEAGLTPVLVVLGHECDRLRQELAGLGVRVVENADYKSGMFSSVRCGLSALPNEVARCVVALVDQPRVEVEIVRRLVLEHRRGSAAATIPRYGDQTGHPIVVSRDVIDAALAADPAGTLRDVLAGFVDRTQHVDVDTDSVIVDVDTLDDYERQRPR